MAARIDVVLAIDDVDHVDDAHYRVVADTAVRMISGVASRHFMFFIECQLLI
jgi:hypothetical protein